MPVETLRALEAFAKQGVQVFATRRTPALAPGYLATAADHADVVAAADRLFRGPAPSGVFVARDAGLAAALTSRLTPDVAVSAGSADIGFVHRRMDEADIYFVANTSNMPLTVDATFRVSATVARQLNPLDGSAASVAVRRAPRGTGATVALDLAPYGSTVIVFPAGPAAAARPPARAARPPAVPSPLDISAGWRVTFGPSGAPAEWGTLRSWTDDEATRHFSGVAVYEKTVDVPAAMLGRGLAVTLDLGPPNPIETGGPQARMRAWVDAPVRDAAIVYVNGRRAGSAWCPPYSVDVTPALRPGPNHVRIEVANLAINHMAGRALPDYKLLNLRYGTRFEPQDMGKVQPVPAGLFGPIRLVSVAARPPATPAR